MKKLSCVLMVVLLLSISGCVSKKNPRTDAEIQADCLNLSEIKDNLVSMNSFTIISTSLDGDVFHANVEISLETDGETVMAEVPMTYMKAGTQWVLSDPVIGISSVTSNDAPTPSSAYALMADDLYINFYDGKYFQKSLDTSVAQTFAFGSAIFEFIGEGSNEIWSNHHEGAIVVSYTLADRWHLVLTEQSYSETTDWSGTWLINGKTTIVITGTISIGRDSSGKESIVSTLVGKYTLNGVDYEVAGIVNPDKNGSSTRHVIFRAETNPGIALDFDFTTTDLDRSSYSASIVGTAYDLSLVKTK